MKRHALATVTALTVSLAAADVSAQQPPPPAGPATPAAPAAPAAAPVRVHVRTFKKKGKARLYIRHTDGSYALVCAAPCTADVPGNSELRVSVGNNDDESHAFVLPSDLGSEVDLEVRPASAGPLVGSIVLIGSGGVFVVTGLLFVALSDFAAGSISSSSASTSSNHESVSRTYKTTGYVMIGIGAAAAIAGFVWLTSRSHEPQVTEWPHEEPNVYSRRDTLLGDVALAKPRDPTSAAETLPAPLLPLHYGFSF